MTTLHHGDAIEHLSQLPAGSVQCCVTSPPYFGLRDYGHDRQIGLEPTPEAYVAKLVDVFREVRRVLRDDGTLWLNLGDSYAGAGPSGASYQSETTKKRAAINTDGAFRISKTLAARGLTYADKKPVAPPGLKAKDLIGIPWRVAFALQQPYYTGKVADERDRVWLAAMVDTEGSICGTEYQTGERTKTNIYISVTNTSVPIIEKCERLFPQDVKHVYEKSGPSARACYRWDVERMETKAMFLREIYPYLVAKRKQAIVGYTFLEMQCGLPSKKKGYLPEQQERRSWLMAALSKLNSGEDVDLPDWVVEPPSLFEPGFYLRQDIIWHKPAPMPESVRDRCTKAHEYLFLLTKSARYYWDHKANQEPAVGGWKGSEFHTGKTGDHQQGRSSKKPRVNGGACFGKQLQNADGTLAQQRQYDRPIYQTRNRRSVWTVASQPFKGAHFAVFPEKLVEPCVLVSSRPGDTVLDPFAGSGTTLAVAQRLGRHAIGVELSPAYCEIINKRLAK